METSKNKSIQNLFELIIEFRDQITHNNRIEGFTISPDGDPREAKLKFDGSLFKFDLHYLLIPSVKELPWADPTDSILPLFVVPNASVAFIEECRKRNVSVIDLNGFVYLRGHGLLVTLPSFPKRRFRFEQEPRNIFVGKSVRIVRALLSDPTRLWRQAELVERTGATSGLVSRIITHLLRQGLVEKSDARRFYVVSHLAILDAWADADNFQKRVTTYHFSSLEGDPLSLAKKIRNQLAHGGPHFAFTQWVGAWTRHPHTEPTIVSLYVPQLPSELLLHELGLRRVTEAGRVWFHVPNDEGVFREVRHENGLPIVSDAQLYIDLQGTGLRGPDQAQALREWPKFCHP